MQVRNEEPDLKRADPPVHSLEQVKTDPGSVIQQRALAQDHTQVWRVPGAEKYD